PLLAMLKHSLFRLGAEAGAHARTVAALERAVLRGPRPRRGSAGLAHALANFKATRGELHRNDPRTFVLPAALDAAERFAETLRQALAPLEMLGDKSHSLSVLAQAHAQAIETLAGDGKAVAAYSGADGLQLRHAFETIAESATSQTLELAP